MLIAKEVHTPFLNASEPHGIYYARVVMDREDDFNTFLTCSPRTTIPILVKNSHEVHPRYLGDDFNEIKEQYLFYTKKLFSLGFRSIALAIDDDCFLQKMLSLRFNPKEFTARKALLIDLFKSLKAYGDIKVVLAVEELAPGGFDATDGVSLARDLESAGLTEIIATSGTRDFLPLYDRRPTHKKRDQPTDFSSHEPTLASALWLLQHTRLSVWCLGHFDDLSHAKDLAKALGLSGLIEKAK